MAETFHLSPEGCAGRYGFATTASLQLESSWFGKLPKEIRDMIYAEFWIVTGARQHVFKTSDGFLTHAPCQLVPGEEDGRNENFEEVWRRQQSRRPRSLVVNTKWAQRFSSDWNDHWRCEEAMKAAGKKRGLTPTLFLSSLLACRRMYLEASASLYASITLVFTSLLTAHDFFVTHPTPAVPLLRSLELSLSVPFEALHYGFMDFLSVPRPYHWMGLCKTLSNLALFGDLRSFHLRLDVAEDRFWWDVRERTALGAIRGILAQGTTVQLPEITNDIESMRRHRFSDGEDTSFKMERYQRLRWMKGLRDGSVVSRLEFYNPRDHAVEGGQSRIEKMRAALRGWLMI